MTNTKVQGDIKYDSLKKLAKQFKQKTIFGHKLTYISNHDPFRFYSVPDREGFGIGSFSPEVAPSVDNKQLFGTIFYKDIYACQGNNFFLGFDNGEYLYVNCWADNDMTLWTTSDPNDHGLCGGDFRLDRFFDNIMGRTLTDVEFLVTDEFGEDPDPEYDSGGTIYECGDYSFFGRVKLIFDDRYSLFLPAT